MTKKDAARVKIAVLNDAGDISYFPGVLHVDPGADLEWICETGPLTIWFKDKSPLKEGRELRAGQHQTVKGTVSTGAQPGVYHYAVATLFGGKIHLDIGCPEIIVNQH